jgi:TonB family protein
MANPTLAKESYPRARLGDAVLPRAADERVTRTAELQPVVGARPNLFYERHGLLENPFGVTPDPHYLYQSRTHAEARSSLIIGVECGIGFQSLIAPPGMGKTTILFDLLQRFSDVACTAFLFQPHGDSHSFLRYLISELGDEAHDSDLVDMQDKINYLLIREHRAGRQTIVIVDEAQSLDNSVLETLRLLSNFETPTEKLLHIILTGQPQLSQRLAAPELAQLSQRISIRTTLIPFDLEDTRNYVEHRLKIAGYRGPPLFTPETLRSIWERSGGVPREINTLCFNALLLATAVGQKEVDSQLLREVVADLDLNPVGFGTGRTPRPIKGMQTTDVLTDAPGDQSATSIDKIRKAAKPSAKKELEDFYTRPTVSDGGVQAAEIPPANCQNSSEESAVRHAELKVDHLAARVALAPQRALTTDVKKDEVSFAANRVVGSPSCQMGAANELSFGKKCEELRQLVKELRVAGIRRSVANSAEVSASSPETLYPSKENDGPKWPLKTQFFPNNGRWIAAFVGLVTLSAVIPLIRSMSQRDPEIPSVPHIGAPHKPEAVKIPEEAQDLTNKHYAIQSERQQPSRGTQDTTGPFRREQKQRMLNSPAHQTISAPSEREIFVEKEPVPRTAVDKLFRKVPIVESRSTMIGAREADPGNQVVNATPETRIESSRDGTVEDENSDSMRVVDKSAAKLPNVDKLSNIEDVGNPALATVMSNPSTPGVNSGAGRVTNIVSGRLIRQVKPVYPPEALKARIQGSVLLQIIVDNNGMVREVRSISGLPMLATAAINAVEHWRYQPSSLNGQPLESEALVTVKFSLR